MLQRFILTLLIGFALTSCGAINSWTEKLFGQKNTTLTIKPQKNPANKKDENPPLQPNDSDAENADTVDTNFSDMPKASDVNLEDVPERIAEENILPQPPAPALTEPIAETPGDESSGDKSPATESPNAELPLDDAPSGDTPSGDTANADEKQPSLPIVETTLPTPNAEPASAFPPDSPKNINPFNELKPQKIVAQVGGTPSQLFADERFLYVVYGSKLVIYTTDLESKSVVYLKNIPLNLKTRSDGNQTWVYVIEAGNQVEVFAIQESGQVDQAKAFGAGGSIDFLLVDESRVHLSVMMTDRVQALDVTKPEAIQVLWEYKDTAVTQIFQLGQTLIAKSNKGLSFLDATTLQVRSIIPFQQAGQQSFSVLGFSPDFKKLWLGLVTTDIFKSVVELTLSEDQKGVVGFGKTVSLQNPLADMGLIQDQLMGFSESALHFVSPKNGEVIRSSFKVVTTNSAAAFGVNHDFLVKYKNLSGLLGSPKNLFDTHSVNAHHPDTHRLNASRLDDSRVKEDVTIEESALQKVPPVKGLAVPLVNPQQGEAPGAEKTISLFQSLAGVWLNSAGVVVWNQADETRFYQSSSLTKAQFSLLPIKMVGKPVTQPQLWEASRKGLFFEDQNSHHIMMVKSDLTEVTTVLATSKSHWGLDIFPLDEKQEYMVTLSGDKQKMALQGGLLDAKPYRPSKPLSLPMATGGVRAIGLEQVLVGCGGSLCVVDLGTNRSKYSLNRQIPLSDPTFEVKDILISPNYKAAYVLAGNGQAMDMFLFTIGETLVEVGRLSQLPVDAIQFRGASYTSGGLVLILPQKNGAAFYDVSNPAQPQLQGIWEKSSATFVDVTDRGRVVCGAFVDQGLICGEFSR